MSDEIKLFFDESGHHTDEVITVAGVIASRAAWEDFERRWNEELVRANVSTFRMSQFENRIGEFSGWSNDRRLELISSLAQIFKDTIALGVSHSIIVKEFREIAIPALPKIKASIDPYLWLLHTCLEDILLFTNGATDIACFFEENERGEIKDYFLALKRDQQWEGRYGPLVFAPKHTLVPLQAADMLAYESFKYFKNESSGSPRPMRKLLKSLVDAQRLSVGVFERDNMPRLVEVIRAVGTRMAGG